MEPATGMISSSLAFPQYFTRAIFGCARATETTLAVLLWYPCGGRRHEVEIIRGQTGGPGAGGPDRGHRGSDVTGLFLVQIGRASCREACTSRWSGGQCRRQE